MAINFTKFYNGLNVVPQNTTDPDAPGDIRYNSGSNKLEIVDGSGRSSVVTESGSVSLTNKSIDATQNTIQNLTFSNFGPSDIPARRDLSNLQTTAINLSLSPSANNTINLGSVTNQWLNVYGQNILSTNLANMVVGTSDTASGFLFQGSSTNLNTSRAPIQMLTQKIIGLGNPTAAQDAVTKTYVDTNFPNVTIGTANGLSLSTQTLSLAAASTSTTGALTSTDWNTFNSKQAAGNYITDLTGDVTASGPGSAAATLAAVNASPGTFTNATITVNAKGLVTSASGGTTAVTGISVASANGFAGTSSGGATPALTLSTTVTGVLKGNGTAISAATAGTDYSAGTSALATGILRSTTTTGALSIAVADDFPTLNQNTTGTAANITATSNATLTTLSVLSLPTSQLTGTLAAGQFPALTGDITTTTSSLATTLATVNSNVGQFAVATYNAKGLATAATNITGDATTSGAALTLATVNANVGSFGSTTAIPNFTVNAKGLITAAGTTAVVAPAGTLSGTTLAATVTASSLTSVGTITSGTWNGTAIAILRGGTGQTTAAAGFNALSPVTTTGDLIIGNGVNSSTRLAIGANNFVLTSNGTTATWAANAAAAPVTTKGDLFTFSTVNARLPVGSDARALVADSSTATGLRWTTTPNFGVKNYFTYNDFENAATTGWSLGTVGTLTNAIPTGTPTFGSGAAGTLAITTVASGQLAGTNSLSYASSVATTVGNMLASQAYTIDIEDQAKVLTWKFSYSPTVGASTANWSGTNSASFGVAIWDVTNSVWLTSTANFALTQSSGVGVASGTVQTGATTASLRFVIYNANATSGAITVLFDSFSLSQQTAPIGAAVTDLGSIAWVPTLGATTTPPTPGTNALLARAGREGDLLKLEYTFNQTAAGSAGSGTYLIPLPAGLSFDTTKITPSTNSAIASIVGQASFFNANNPFDAFGTVFAHSTTQMAVRLSSNATAGAAANLWGSTYGSLSQTSICLQFKVRAPIAGWSSNVQMSSDTDTRLVSFFGTKSSGQSATADVTNITFTAVKDTHAAWNGSQYVVPISGDYMVTCTLTESTSAQLRPDFWVNGVRRSIGTLGQLGQPVNSSGLMTSLVAGDLISIRTANSGTPNGSGLTIFRISGPATIAASESVNAVYTTAAGQSIPNNTPTVVVFGTRVNDTHNAMNTTTGLYTVPVSGQYRVSGGLYYASATASIATDCQLILRRNGTTVLGTNNPKSGTGVAPMAASGSFTYPFLAGDTIALGATQTLGSAQGLLVNAAYNFISIERVGN